MNQTVMDEKNCREAAFAFAYYKKDLPASSDDTLTIEPLSGGLINHSYKISSNSKAPFLLQEINQHVFKKPEKLQQNYINIWQFAEFEFTDVNLPAPLYHDRGKTLYRDNKENTGGHLNSWITRRPMQFPELHHRLNQRQKHSLNLPLHSTTITSENCIS